MSFSPEAAARFVAQAHESRSRYQNLPADVGPRTIPEAYAAQAALHRLLAPKLGPLAGRKIATTTKVMQALLGIDHPCGGAIFASRVHASPARIAKREFVNLRFECELAVRLGRDLPHAPDPWTAAGVRPAVSAVMPAFELIEDRNADYRETSALSMIADNCWNAGIVLGTERAPPDGLLDGIHGRLSVNGRATAEGRTDDPMGALAFIANLAAGQGQPIKSGDVVITGSLMVTFDAAVGDTLAFEIDGLGSAALEVA